MAPAPMAVASGLLGAVGSILFARGDCDVWTRLSRIPTSFYRDKVVLITGSNSGIGKAMCEVLARMQANLIISGRDEGALAALSHSLLALGARSVRVCVLDLSHGSDVVEDAARRACGMHGRLDVLINNGGVSVRASAAELELAGVKRVMDINYFAPVALTRACLPALLRHNIHRGDQGGIIINTSSIASTIALPNRSSYASSKAALERFFDAFRHENPSVHVLSLLPGRTATNLSRNAVTARYHSLSHLLPRFMAIHRVANILISINKKLQVKLCIRKASPRNIQCTLYTSRIAFSTCFPQKSTASPLHCQRLSLAKGCSTAAAMEEQPSQVRLIRSGLVFSACWALMSLAKFPR